eukprot:5396838-Prymnesium_polylepis.1
MGLTPWRVSGETNAPTTYCASCSVCPRHRHSARWAHGAPPRATSGRSLTPHGQRGGWCGLVASLHRDRRSPGVAVHLNGRLRPIAGEDATVGGSLLAQARGLAEIPIELLGHLIHFSLHFGSARPFSLY